MAYTRGIRWKIGVFVVIFCCTALPSLAADMKMSGEKARPFQGTTIEGKAISLDTFLSRKVIVVLSFWGIRCSACIEEMPALRKIQEDFRNNDVHVLGVNVDGLDHVSLLQMVGEEKIDPKYTLVADPDFKIADAYRMKAAPLTIVVDQSGTIRYVHEDYKPGDEAGIREAIMRLLPAAGK
ncbi:MAG: TlpA disulfide reductase family protein [bacterium]|nr:TlpA disulfide reductase family protein [bacterium]